MEKVKSKQSKRGKNGEKIKHRADRKNINHVVITQIYNHKIKISIITINVKRLKAPIKTQRMTG